jgi:N4-gp56 family major capsid protein
MALTNFAAMQPEEKAVWARDVWMAARNASFLMQFAGKGPNSMVQRITELTKSEKGTRAIIPLVTDLTGDGINGDVALEGAEEAISSYYEEIKIDQLRNANRLKGRMADQASVINFRTTSKDVLAYWLADRMDQMGLQALSGISFTKRPNGATRPDTILNSLAFGGSEVTAPTASRYRMWNGTDLVAGATNSDSIANPTYEMLVQLKAYAKDQYIRGVRGPGNTEFYHVFMTPRGLAKLKMDSVFRANLQNAGPRGEDNPLFSGSLITQDGLVIHEFRHVCNTTGLTTSNKWGATGTIDGQALLLCGAQALGMADIGLPYWVEDDFDYENQYGISVGKIFGLKKPVFRSTVTGDDQDFGVIRVNTRI